MSTILQEIIAYFKTRLTLLKYETADRSIAIIADILADLTILLALGMAFIFFTIALAFFVTILLGSLWMGFGAVSILYIVLMFLSHLLRSPFHDRLIHMLVRKIFKNKS